MNSFALLFTGFIRETAVRVAEFVPVVILTAVFFNSTAIAQHRTRLSGGRSLCLSPRQLSCLVGGIRRSRASANGNILAIAGPSAFSGAVYVSCQACTSHKPREKGTFLFCQEGDISTLP